MEQSFTVNQYNSEGNNNFTIKLAQEVFRPYEKVLSVGVEKKFLDDASENLIRDRKLHLNVDYINQVKQYLDEKKFCLIKAPEGRGKTYLSRIIAFDYYHNQGMEIYFLDFKDNNGITINNIDDILQEWHKNNHKQYLLVIENVHAYKELLALRSLINGWINSNGNCFCFLLNTRPTDIELDDFSNWGEIVELNPNKDDVDDIINLFSKEVGRKPFASDRQRDSFVEKIYPNKKKSSGANLRLLKIYLETWQNHNEIQYISSVSEKTVIDEFRRLYLLYRSQNEVEALWYISSLFQFDVPLHEDFVFDVGNLVEDGLLRFEKNKYYLPHSVDATFLYKAICDYRRKNYADQMKTFADCFVKKILDNNYPRDFESDFKLLFYGLYARKDEFKDVYYLTNVDIAPKIITNLYPGFVVDFFHPKNHEESNRNTLLLDYYLNNKDWLKPLFQELSSNYIIAVNNTFKNRLGYINLVKDIFEDPKDWDNYLRINQNNAFINFQLILAITELGDDHKTILIGHYKKIKDTLKPVFRGLVLSDLSFVYKVYETNLNINIVKDIFEDPKDLGDYLKAHLSIDFMGSFMYELFVPIINLSSRHKAFLMKYYKKNKNLLKPMFLRLSRTSLFFAFEAYMNHLKIDIVKDIFEDTKDLDDYLKAHQNISRYDYRLFAPIINCGTAHKKILIDYYENNKDMLKPTLCRLSPISLFRVYYAYKSRLDINIVKDLFTDLDALKKYLETYDIRAFQEDGVLKAIEQLGDEHKQLLYKYNAFDHFFYSKKSTINNFRVGPAFILSCWAKKRNFDVRQIRDNKFYLDGVTWANLEKFVSLIERNMTEENRQQSISIVKTIIRLVFAKKNALSYASAKNLSFFYYSIASVDKADFQKLVENNTVHKDIERRIEAFSYSMDELYLFDHFFNQSWCKATLEPKILNADKAQKKIIKKWHDEFLKKLADRGREITSESLLDYIHHNLGLANSLSEDEVKQ